MLFIGRKIIISLFYIFFLCTQIARAESPIDIEVKTFGDDVVFIFHLDKTHVMDLFFDKKSVTARVNIPSKFKLNNKELFDQYANDFEITDKNQNISFDVNADLEYTNIINGENLIAIKFLRNQNHKASDLEAESIVTISNDPNLIGYNHILKEHILSFNTEDNGSKIAAFFEENYLWIVFDQKQDFSFKERGVFSKFEIIPSESGAVMRMKLEDSFNNAQIEKTHIGWDIKISSKTYKSANKNDIFRIQESDEFDLFKIKGNFANSSIISFEHPDIAEMVSVIPTAYGRVTKQRDYVGFTLMRSIQGVAFVIHSDDFSLEKKRNRLEIQSNESLPEEKILQKNMFALEVKKYLTQPTILPYKDKKLDVLDFNTQKSRLIMEASIAETDDKKFDRNFDLAKFFFIHGWYQESLQALEIGRLYSDLDYYKNLQARFLMAINYTMIGDLIDAQKEYEALLAYNGVSKIPEIDIWNKYNNFSIGSNISSLNDKGNLLEAIDLYSEEKYWALIFVQFEILLANNSLGHIDKLFKEIRVPIQTQHANSLNFYKASYYRRIKQEDLAIEYYSNLANQNRDLFNKVRAEYELLKLKLSRGEMDVVEAIEILNVLKWQWRGDQLEYEMLAQLALYYHDIKDIMNTLRTYQYIKMSFSNRVSNFYIISEMANIFNNVFLYGSLQEEMSDFSIVALFYEFKDLNPIGEQGDKVIVDIAQRLVRLDLLEDATNLLRHQVDYRLRGKKRIEAADNLAIILILDNKPNEALLILDETDKENFSFSEYEYRKRIRAEALMQLGRIDDVLEYLKDDASEDARNIRLDALFKSKYWDRYILFAEGELLDDSLNKVNSDEAVNTAAKQNISRLALAYYMINENDKLIGLSKNIGNNSPELKNMLELLITSSVPINQESIGSNLNQNLDTERMKKLLDKYIIDKIKN
ncbi:hypothetical protein OAP56_03110 [Rickettsiaceae bacterium]|nr:hypothetical protein [Rickettsiaceae bacterium]